MAGIAVVDYANWFDQTWHVPFDGTKTQTAIVKKDLDSLNTYIEGDILLPGKYHYKIIGTFDDQHAPTFQSDASFYFPLKHLTNMQGFIFTNVTEKMALTELKNIVEKMPNFTLEPQTYQDRRLNIWEVIIRLTLDGFVTRSMLLTFLGLIFFATFAVSMLYRERNRYMSVHHLYGATYSTLFIKLSLRLLVTSLLGTGLGYLIGRSQLNLIYQPGYFKVALMAGIFNIVFACLIQISNFAEWKKKYQGKEGRY